jgi:hypothetical protein
MHKCNFNIYSKLFSVNGQNIICDIHNWMSMDNTSSTICEFVAYCYILKRERCLSIHCLL